MTVILAEFTGFAAPPPPHKIFHVPTTTTVGSAAADTSQDEDNTVGTDMIANYVGDLSDALTDAINQINDVNANTHLLALNARIEAARAGASGAAFGVVAEEMQQLSSTTAKIANGMATRTKGAVDHMLEVIGSSIRGGRLSDMALTNIDLVDRNLYERTCDVRWWATDSSLVDALTLGTPESHQFASHRLGVILSAYTVYHDLVLCDLDGRIIANGKPSEFQSIGTVVDQSAWFRSAERTNDGDQYGFETAHRSSLVNGQSVLGYSCGVREGGLANGKLLGVLGILFNWEEFAQMIMEQSPLSSTEKSRTRCCICDDQGKILADSRGHQLSETLELEDREQIFAEQKNYVLGRYNGQTACIAHAKAPGFETYSTGWHSLVIQTIEC